jgi:alkylation response protein AidB-like acyl-CoA dehydrogenase
MSRFPKFGDTEVPFAEPSWYRGNPTPYYQEKHVKWREKVRSFVDKELRPHAHKWDEAIGFPVEEMRKKAYDAGILSPLWPAELGGQRNLTLPAMQLLSTCLLIFRFPQP